MRTDTIRDAVVALLVIIALISALNVLSLRHDVDDLQHPTSTSSPPITSDPTVDLWVPPSDPCDCIVGAP